MNQFQARILRSRLAKLDEIETYLDGLIQRAKNDGLLDEGQLKELGQASDLIGGVVLELSMRLSGEGF